jgi:MFS family permease
MSNPAVIEREEIALASPGTPRSARLALASLGLATLLSSLGTSVANVALPVLADAFGASIQQVQWVVLAYLLAIATLIVGAGRVGDLWGRRRLLLAGIALFTLASLLSAVAPTLLLLVLGRALQGVGAAVMMALATAFVADVVSKQKTGSAMGLLGTMSASGTALGPTLGGVLIAGFGWPAIFWAHVPLGLLALLLAWRFLPRDVPGSTARRGFDGWGTLLLAVTLAVYALATTTGRGSFGLLNLALLAAAALGLALFVVAERRAASPLLPFATLRSPLLRTALASNAIVSTVLMTTLVVGPFYLAQGLGLSPAAVGLAMSVGPVVAAVTGAPAGRIVDRVGAGRMTLAGLTLVAVGTLLLAAMPMAFGVGGYIGPMVVATAGYATFQAANNTAVMTGVDPGERGVVSGMLSLSRNLGLITGASAMGALFALTGSMQATFAVATLLVLAAFTIALTGRARPA